MTKPRKKLAGMLLVTGIVVMLSKYILDRTRTAEISPVVSLSDVLVLHLDFPSGSGAQYKLVLSNRCSHTVLAEVNLGQFDGRFSFRDDEGNHLKVMTQRAIEDMMNGSLNFNNLVFIPPESVIVWSGIGPGCGCIGENTFYHTTSCPDGGGAIACFDIPGPSSEGHSCCIDF